MGDVWAFLSNPENQKTLAWLGGGLMMLAGGVWTVITYFAGRKASPPPPSEPASGEVTATGGVAAGRDLRARHIRVGGPPVGSEATGDATRGRADSR